MAKLLSQTVLTLQRYRYLHKSCNNPLCPRGESMGLIMRDFDRILNWLADGSKKLFMRIKNNERYKIKHFNFLRCLV